METKQMEIHTTIIFKCLLNFTELAYPLVKHVDLK